MEIAADTITERDSSNSMNSSSVASDFPTNRKAESDPVEESEESGDENEESGDEIEESSDEFEDDDSLDGCFGLKWIKPQWDVDSFENLKFDEEEEEKGTENIDENDLQNWLRFRRQHIENKGFYVDPELWPMYKYSNYRVIQDFERSAGLGQTYRDFFEEMACLCLQKFNQKEKEKEKEKDEKFFNVEFVKVVGAVVRPSGCPKSYITFMAKEKPGGPDVEYQAKVWSDLVKHGRKNYPILCRRAPPPKTSNYN